MASKKAARLQIDQRSLRRVIGRIHLKGEKMKRQAATFLFQRGEEVMEESKRECPVDTGTLRSSGFVHSPDVERGEMSVALGYGGAAAEYAIFVHEDLTAHHPVGKAKFLEDPIRREVPRLARDLAEFIKV